MISLVRLLLFVTAFLLIRRVLQTRRRFRATTSARRAASPVATDLQACAVCGLYLPAEAVACARPECPRSRKDTNKTAAAALCLIFLSFLAVPACAADGDEGGRYLVQVEGEHAEVSLTVNNIPAEHWFLDRKGRAGASINHWLREGSNTLEVVLPPATSPGSVKVHAWFLGVGTKDGMQMVDLLPPQDVVRDATGRGRVAVTFKVPSAPSLSIWLAEQAPLPDREVLADLLSTFRDQVSTALVADRSPLDSASLALERQDNIRAYGGHATQPPLEVSAVPGQNAVRMTASPEAVDLDVAPLPGTTLVRVGRSDGRPLLAGEAGTVQFSVPAVLVGYMSGAWRILRRCH